ncbi:hypothetical protein IscW_ISCW002413 [Ixodes scapularis]|uniref:Uncharacterized protein n=1 Tax=Ixodes scapularis TaxID=6945 RepID=B7PC42_IXOSC|nr:hypothetical protein IscW_ISCW002413 [Ixodes scapularis]|eukprot:XP_002409324.1 hypothetical protein IscW_ISCW002413 [Ixodes scapularis]
METLTPSPVCSPTSESEVSIFNFLRNSSQARQYFVLFVRLCVIGQGPICHFCFGIYL